MCIYIFVYRYERKYTFYGDRLLYTDNFVRFWSQVTQMEHRTFIVAHKYIQIYRIECDTPAQNLYKKFPTCFGVAFFSLVRFCVKFYVYVSFFRISLYSFVHSYCLMSFVYLISVGIPMRECFVSLFFQCFAVITRIDPKKKPCRCTYSLSICRRIWDRWIFSLSH